MPSSRYMCLQLLYSCDLLPSVVFHYFSFCGDVPQPTGEIGHSLPNQSNSRMGDPFTGFSRPIHGREWVGRVRAIRGLKLQPLGWLAHCSQLRFAHCLANVAQTIIFWRRDARSPNAIARATCHAHKSICHRGRALHVLAGNSR